MHSVIKETLRVDAPGMQTINFWTISAAVNNTVSMKVANNAIGCNCIRDVQIDRQFERNIWH